MLLSWFTSLFLSDDGVISDRQWKSRFVKEIVHITGRQNREYALQAAEAYLPDRDQYESPEEAAQTDVSYWD